MNTPSIREIYELFSKRVYNTALSITQNAADAEDITQEVFIEIHRSLEKFKGESSLSTWIYRIAVNRSLDLLRSKKRRRRWGIVQSIFGSNDEPIDIPEFHHPGIELENKERASILFKAIDRLPENQKTAFVLAMIEELPQKEIAEVMGIGLKAVESLLQRAKANLRDDLEIFYPDRRN